MLLGWKLIVGSVNIFCELTRATGTWELKSTVDKWRRGALHRRGHSCRVLLVSKEAWNVALRLCYHELFKHRLWNHLGSSCLLLHQSLSVWSYLIQEFFVDCLGKGKQELDKQEAYTLILKPHFQFFWRGSWDMWQRELMGGDQGWMHFLLCEPAMWCSLTQGKSHR